MPNGGSSVVQRFLGTWHAPLEARTFLSKATPGRLERPTSSSDKPDAP